jgi:hypothetical protein
MVVAAVAALGCRSELPRPRKTHLTVMPAGVRRGVVSVSDDATAWAFVASDGQRQRVHASSGVGPPFRNVGRPEFAPGTARLFYWATPGGGSEGVLVAEGHVVLRGVRGQGALVFSKAGTRWAAVARESQEDDEYDDEGNEPLPPALVVVDGGEPQQAPDVSLPSFSGDDAHVAYLRADDRRALTLVVDGEGRSTYAPPEHPCSVPIRVPPGAPSLSPRVDTRYLSDGTLLVVAQDRDGWGVFRGHQRLASYPGRATLGDQPTVNFVGDCDKVSAFAPSSVVTATEAPVVAWWERPPGPEERWRVVVDGRPVDDRTCIRWWTSQPPEFSPDGHHVAYPCVSPEGGVFLVFEGREHGPYQDVWGFTISDDGQHVAYGASRKAETASWAIYVDGEPRTKSYTSVWRPRFSPRGDHLAWEAMPSRLPQGVLGLDSRKLLTFDEILWGPVFEPSGVVSWAIRHGRKITRIDVPVS